MFHKNKVNNTIDKYFAKF